MRNALHFINNRKRKLLLLLIDLVILLVMSVINAHIEWPDHSAWEKAFSCWGVLALLLLAYQFLLKAYRPVWRVAGPTELLSLVNSYLLTCITALAVNRFFRMNISVAFSLYTVLTSALTSAYCRIVYKSLHNVRKRATHIPNERPIAIIGAGDAGVALMREISQNKNSPYSVWGFFDDDRTKIGMAIDGVPIRGSIESISENIKASDVHDIVLAIPSLELERRREIVQLCSGLNCKLRIMPDLILTMENETGRLSKSIREIRIEDLLGRSSVSFKAGEMSDFLQGKTVLVTGGGGSIGSELCRQVACAGARTLIIFDVNENTSYLLQNEIRQQISSHIQTVVEIGSMTDIHRVRDVFRTYRPDVVFHAAAHKHVPLMEHCPYEAVKNNILGSYNVFTAASAEHVAKLVFISTDKAVKPSSVMGATKRYCENMMLALSRQPENETCFVSVRFGNVLGSAGSVIPIFQEQIAHGGPVTVTDKRMTRYFMTISEAVGLVLKSGAMAQSSETYILDMGKPVKIIEMAENLIRLCNLEPYLDIPIIETGLRPGEKLREELLVGDTNHIATRESKIFVERNDTVVSWNSVLEQLSELEAAVNSADNYRIVSLLHSYVPDYHDADDTDANTTANISEIFAEPVRERFDDRAFVS